MSQFRCTEDFEEMLANYMDSFKNFRTYQTDCDNLWSWWLHNRHRLPSQRLAQISAERRAAGNCPRV